MARISQVVVLVEDQNQQRLVFRYLTRLGYKPNDIRLEPLASKGSGEQWVRSRYPLNVQAYRRRAVKARSALIVAIDADTGEVAWRARQLEESLHAKGLPPRSERERIVHLIPKRNIETWILNLNGGNVDEISDYSRSRDVADQIAKAAQTLFEWTRRAAAVPQACVASLKTAISEIGRIE